MEDMFSWQEMKVVNKPSEEAPVFLKANQQTGDVYIRVEHGLGEGILIGCQHDNSQKIAETLGPFPLNFFENDH